MPNFIEYNVKLQAMGGMGRVTGTMKMVATSHLHRAQKELHMTDPFLQTLRRLLNQFCSDPSLQEHRVIQAPPDKRPSILIFVLSADRGLCGAFNSNVIRETKRWAEDQRRTRDAKLHAVYIGEKAYQALKKEIPTDSSPVAVDAHPTLRHSNLQSAYAIRAFLDGRYDEVWLIGNRFVSTMVYTTKAMRIFPFAMPLSTEKVSSSDEIIIEPDPNSLLTSVARQVANLAIFQAELSSVASEHAARMLAMDSATKNLVRMQKELIVLRNRARQAAITNELTEIVSGAESLNN